MTIKLADFQLRGGLGTGQVTLTLGPGGQHRVEINGLTFTGHPDATTPATREFNAGRTAFFGAEYLARLINHPKFGIPKVSAAHDGMDSVAKKALTGKSLKDV